MTVTSSDTQVIDELTSILGLDKVAIDEGTRSRASVDEATMSPILAANLPNTIADAVVYPEEMQDVLDIVNLAVQAHTPLTPRGKGTGNYGQAVPLSGGIVIDFTRMRKIWTIEDGVITAEPGARMIELERHATSVGQQLWMYPSTVQSTLGGFIAGGSGGTGSIRHGGIPGGFVAELEVVHAVQKPEIVKVAGDDVTPYLHAYGLTGLIVGASVRLEPLQDWSVVYGSFSTLEDTFELIQELPNLNPAPRLVSADESEITSGFPKDAAIPQGRASLRAIVDSRLVGQTQHLIEAAGGMVEEVRKGLGAMVKASGLSYNHPSWFLIRKSSTPLFHMEVGGKALIESFDEMKSVYPGALIHLEGNIPEPHGMITAPYTSKEDVLQGLEQLNKLGIGFHNPHQWYIDRNVDLLRETAIHTDPTSLLNPGHWPSRNSDPSSNVVQEKRREAMNELSRMGNNCEN
ncbi:FAD-binding oxidoreductase [Nesterenkonia ebinurensis]|uniref:FAD-binding oxidoreductase n=1 Tax=Nesterenkonia ebinurensis TaxID=2608252 RepID=UPI00123DBC9D|nr:FAD-binding oxidoreductase [Nesterenkonia ebinurensis]